MIHSLILQNTIIVFAIFGWAGLIGLAIRFNRTNGRKKWLIPDRLNDVIRLINALALESNDFKTENDIMQALRVPAQSAASWHEVAAAHPEFFRPNGAFTHYALTARSYNQIVDGRRPVLSQTDTQKIIDLAVTLHQKEEEKGLRYVLWFPLIAAVIAALAAIIPPLLK